MFLYKRLHYLVMNGEALEEYILEQKSDVQEALRKFLLSFPPSVYYTHTINHIVSSDGTSFVKLLSKERENFKEVNKIKELRNISEFLEMLIPTPLDDKKLINGYSITETQHVKQSYYTSSDLNYSIFRDLFTQNPHNKSLSVEKNKKFLFSLAMFHLLSQDHEFECSSEIPNQFLDIDTLRRLGIGVFNESFYEKYEYLREKSNFDALLFPSQIIHGDLRPEHRLEHRLLCQFIDFEQAHRGSLYYEFSRLEFPIEEIENSLEFYRDTYNYLAKSFHFNKKQICEFPPGSDILVAEGNLLNAAKLCVLNNQRKSPQTQYYRDLTLSYANDLF